MQSSLKISLDSPLAFANGEVSDKTLADQLFNILEKQTAGEPLLTHRLLLEIYKEKTITITKEEAMFLIEYIAHETSFFNFAKAQLILKLIDSFKKQ